jgi:hypothetical protein
VLFDGAGTEVAVDADVDRAGAGEVDDAVAVGEVGVEVVDGLCEGPGSSEPLGAGAEVEGGVGVDCRRCWTSR